MATLWSETVEAHRREVRGAVLDTAARLVGEHGLLSVTMSQIAEETGIGRATLYKYFPDVEAILLAWHERHIRGHLELLEQARHDGEGPGERLRAVLEAYALVAHESHRHHDTELAAFVHRHEQVVRAERSVRDMIGELVAEAQQAGVVRDDLAPDELASFCVHALAGAGAVASKPAVGRLVAVTLDALQPHRDGAGR